jgi:hypothetical protein
MIVMGLNVEKKMVVLLMESLNVMGLSSQVPNANWVVEKWRSTVPSHGQTIFLVHALGVGLYHMLFQQQLHRFPSSLFPQKANLHRYHHHSSYQGHPPRRASHWSLSTSYQPHIDCLTGMFP